jgi:hypothetical protein
MDSARVVRRFEDEFKNNSNFAIVDELMSEDSSTTCPTRGCRRARRDAGRTGTRHRRDS